MDKQKLQLHVIKAKEPMGRALAQVEAERARTPGEWIAHPVNLRGYRQIVDNSVILPQCIRVYKNNIAGFGMKVSYNEDYPDETEEMKAEYDHISRVVELLSVERDTKAVFEEAISLRETYGIAYIEAVRDVAGRVAEIHVIPDVPSVTKSVPLDMVRVQHTYRGEPVFRERRFRKYKQEMGGQTVYFKEFGDPRGMDRNTGVYTDNLQPGQCANEILELKTGDGPYGCVRWIGQILGTDGSHEAELLNNRYFKEGRHTPMMLLVKNGMLTEQSHEQLQQYMDDVRGGKGQHAFLLLELKDEQSGTVLEGVERPDIEVKELASILQRDELFQEYMDNTRRRVQSAFQLPDLYVAYTTDFNRATAQMAQEVTEQQVFRPERRELAWMVNNMLLREYNLKYCKVEFAEPHVTNVDDLAKILSVVERAGGITPNKAKDIAYRMLGESAENYTAEWAETPVAVGKV